jgi:hypothetical protein
MLLNYILEVFPFGRDPWRTSSDNGSSNCKNYLGERTFPYGAAKIEVFPEEAKENKGPVEIIFPCFLPFRRLTYLANLCLG